MNGSSHCSLRTYYLCMISMWLWLMPDWSIIVWMLDWCVICWPFDIGFWCWATCVKPPKVEGSSRPNMLCCKTLCPCSGSGGARWAMEKSRRLKAIFEAGPAVNSLRISSICGCWCCICALCSPWAPSKFIVSLSRSFWPSKVRAPMTSPSFSIKFLIILSTSSQIWISDCGRQLSKPLKSCLPPDWRIKARPSVVTLTSTKIWLKLWIAYILHSDPGAPLGAPYKREAALLPIHSKSLYSCILWLDIKYPQSISFSPTFCARFLTFLSSISKLLDWKILSKIWLIFTGSRVLG